ncbi:SAV_6107 family HEPN domain-containing protein [Propionibacteriaceae bacterium Y2011]|uniref:SAV_6107 family HEPN domain-containing protein n=1 Tax=Microlunatus sp. Y2014 TaxID=3418488 RepID=UPI003B4757C9
MAATDPGSRPTPPWARRSGVPMGVRVDLQRARAALVAAELATTPAERYVAAHLTALRVAAVVLAVRATGSTAARSGPTDVWQLLERVAPEYAEWATFFAVTAPRRELITAHPELNVVTTREADDLLRDAGAFLALVENRYGRSG